MAIKQPETTFKLDPANGQISCQGAWTLPNISRLSTIIKNIQPVPKGPLTVDGSGISTLDSSGAWLLSKTLAQLRKQGLIANLTGLTAEQQKLYTLIEKNTASLDNVPQVVHLGWVTRIGKRTIDQLLEFRDFLTFLGELALEIVRLAKNPGSLRIKPILSTIETMGYRALPIIALLSFMIGVVLTYQMGVQLRNYGANIYIVDLLGLSVLREFAPLLTAIMFAGRTGAAFTAQLGTMKINDEIDALKTMGVSPAELLILPRIIGLIIVLPLLVIWADIFGILGGIVMSKNMLNIDWYSFLQRFHAQISINSLLIGLGKAPVFAMIIASIGCFQGIKVAGGSDSVGRQTTKSVVLAIFFIIVADAIFSVIFSKLGI